jgi:aspartyl-tRNA(Asn)/glutamyl-tRNA(Gln) amidotransferase subunit C
LRQPVSVGDSILIVDIGAAARLGASCYCFSMPEPLTIEEVRHVAKLSRLRLSNDQLETYRHQLSSILDYVALLSKLDVTGVQPMAHPTDHANRLGDDVPMPGLSVEQVLANAPAREEAFLAVPKVLDDGEGA